MPLICGGWTVTMRLHSTRSFALIALLLSCVFALCASQQPQPWQGAPFAGDPAQIARAAAAVETAKSHPATVLLDEKQVAVDADGRVRWRARLVYRIESQAALQGWGATSIAWEPWHQKRPTVRARVITQDGVAHVLDPATLSDAPARQDTPEIYSDSRVVRGPLPAAAVGAVVEEEITVEDNEPAIRGGVARRIWVGRSVPVKQTNVVIEVPASVPFKYEVRLLPDAKVTRTTEAGITRVLIEQGPQDAFESPDPNLPPDHLTHPQVEFSTAASWKSLADAYRELSDPKIRPDEVRALVTETISPGDSRIDKIRKLTARLHHEVRYTGIEFGSAKLVPNSPGDVLKRKYGDCKDKATTLVAMLRAAGVSAHLALLDAGYGQDVTPAYPGASMFNHAIVVAPGKPDVWIDATDEYGTIGNLPPADQGRLALVIRDNTSELTKTPQLSATDNLAVEHREFYLSEYGPARVVEWSESHGNIDRNYRSYYGVTGNATRVKKELTEYAKNVYLGDGDINLEAGDGMDISKPFTFRIEIPKAKRGSTSLRDARMALILGAIIARMPDAMRRTDDEITKENARRDKPLPPRTADWFFTPFVTEWQYKIVPPPGFKIRSVPQNSSRDFGPGKLTQKWSSAADGSVIGIVRFDSVKGRYTAAEGEAFRQAALEFRKETATVIAFDQVGYSLLAAGKGREAIAAFESLVKLHPNEALHRIQIANALLEVGVAEAARNEARRAVELEPKSALAHSTRAWILQHDLVGRRFKKGFDLQGALAEYRAALEIDPEDTEQRVDYAILLEHDAHGDRYTRAANLPAAIEQYRELKKRKATWEHLDNNLAYALFYADRYKEAEAAALSVSDSEDRTALLIACRAAQDGAEAGLRRSLELTADEKVRSTALVTAAGKLLRVRQYSAAAALLSNLNTEQSSLELITTVKNTHRYEQMPEPAGNDPVSFMLKLFRLIVAPDSPDPRALELFSKDLKVRTGEEIAVKLEDLDIIHRGLRNAVADLPEQARGDAFVSNVKLTSEGDEHTGYRVTAQMMGLNGLPLYVVKEKDGYRVLADHRWLAVFALQKADANDLAGARLLLDWARDEVSNTASDDPLGTPLLARVWRRGQNGDKARIQLAAAALLAGYKRQVEPLVPMLVAAREKAANEADRTSIDLILESAYQTTEKWDNARQVAERLRSSYPDSALAFLSYAGACLQLKDWDALETAVKQRMDAFPDDPEALGLLTQASATRGQIARTLELLKPAVSRPKANAMLLNNYAWHAIFVTPLATDAIEAAQRAVRLTENKQFGVIHTLATLYAETERPAEARQLMLQAMDNAGMAEPNPSAWYVFGRIAEQYGRNDAALAAYKRVETEEGATEAGSTIQLAKRRMNAIPATAGQ